MPKRRLEISPVRIRAIRESLGLTQEEAGRILGGGSRAFTKYEAGILKPSAAAINLLRLLDVHPDALWVLRGDEPPPVASAAPSPFEVIGQHLEFLTAPAFATLVGRLLRAEAQAIGVPLYGIHVASNIHAPDGGEDGRISWQDGPKRTDFLPSRFCQFQLKTGKVSPTRAGKEVLTRNGDVKPMIRSALEQRGNYIMLCSHRYTEQLVEKRQQAISEALATAGLRMRSDRIWFWEADKIAAWVNSHSSVALWVREEAGLGTPGGFSSWNHWNGRSEHSLPWAEDPRLADFCSILRDRITDPGTAIRVVGLFGIGKSRLCLEALKRVGGDQMVRGSLRDYVIYAVQSEVGSEAIHPIVEKLALSGGRAVVVVDDCDAQTHNNLARMVSRPGSRLSLVTIDNEIPSYFDATTIKIEEAPATVIENIVDQVAATLQDVDQYRLAQLSRGFPEVAIRIAEESREGEHLIYPADDDLIDNFVCGRRPNDQALLLQSAQLLAAFGPVRVGLAEAAHLGKVGTKSSTEELIQRIADLDRNLKHGELYKGIQRLIKRGVVKRRGGLGTIEPRPIAVRLAERQWCDWNPGMWDKLLSGEFGSDLSVSAARILAQLNTTEIAKRVVVHVCREGGHLDRLGGNDDQFRAEVLAAFAQIDADAVAEHISRSLDRIGDLRQLGDNVRAPLVRALRTIAFPSSTFMVGARLMLRLAVTGNTSGTSRESRFFVELFSPVLGGTGADYDSRLLFLDEASETSEQMQLSHVVEALVAGCSVGGYSWTVGPEIQGSRKALDPWLPNSKQELDRYIAECVNRLGKLSARNDSVGDTARSALGGAISSLVCHGHVVAVETAIQKVVDAGCSWSLALRQLKGVLEHFSDTHRRQVRRPRSGTNRRTGADKPSGAGPDIRYRASDARVHGIGIFDIGTDQASLRHRACLG